MLVTGNMSDFYGVNMLPALRSVIDRGLRKRAPQYVRVFNVKTSDRSIEQYSQMTGVGRFQAIDEGKAIRTDQPVQAFKTTFVHKRYGLAVPTTVDTVEDDKWDLIGEMHKDLGWSCYETQELDAASTFNNAFSGSFLGPDAVSLCSTAHPLVKAGGTFSNSMTAADLDLYPLEVALTSFRQQKRQSGELIHLVAKNLVIHPSNAFTAHALLRSKDDPTTSDRSTNPLGGAEDAIPEPFVWDYLTAPNAWFLTAEPSDTGLVWFWRKKPYTKNWTDDYTEVGVVGMRYRKSHGWNNYLGVIGNPGQ